MMNVRALLELCRISNLPTVWSNVAVGVFSGVVAHEYISGSNDAEALSDPAVVTILCIYAFVFMLMVSAFYCAGMALNDYWDRAVDAEERPSRPIPSGQVSPKQARRLFLLLFGAGLVFPTLVAIGPWIATYAEGSALDEFTRHLPFLACTLLLIGCIVAYNRLHAGRPSSVLLMALCRVFAVLTPASFFGIWPGLWAPWLIVLAPAVTVGFYTLFISIVARREMETKRFAGPKTIMNMITAMPLLDAVWLVVMGLWPASLFCVGCSVMTKLAHRKVAGS